MAGHEHMSSVAPNERHGVRSGLWLPLFDELADPVVVAGLAAEAEEAGGTGSSSGTTCAGRRRSGRWPILGSRWRRSPLPPTGCGSVPWSRPSLDRPDQLAEMVGVIDDLHEDSAAPYDVAVCLPIGTDPGLMPRWVPPGGCPSSPPTRCHGTRSAASSTRAGARPMSSSAGSREVLRRQRNTSCTPSGSSSVRSLVPTQAEGVPGRVEVDPPRLGLGRLHLVLPGTQGQHLGLGPVDVVHGHVDVELLAVLGAGPHAAAGNRAPAGSSAAPGRRPAASPTPRRRR